MGQLHDNTVDRMLHWGTVNGTFTLKCRDNRTKTH